MKPTHLLFETDRFPCDWGKEIDFDPPPGRELAQALLDQLQMSLPGEPRGRKIGPRDWEHTSWSVCVRWEDRMYQFDIEASPKESDIPVWHLSVSRVRGLLRAVFGFRKTRFDVNEQFLALVAAAVQSVIGNSCIEWITEDEAQAALWPGRAAKNCAD